jgi:hypothetical protein
MYITFLYLNIALVVLCRMESRKNANNNRTFRKRAWNGKADG